jgi:hypothetical protein
MSEATKSQSPDLIYCFPFKFADINWAQASDAKGYSPLKTHCGEMAGGGEESTHPQVAPSPVYRDCTSAQSRASCCPLLRLCLDSMSLSSAFPLVTHSTNHFCVGYFPSLCGKNAVTNTVPAPPSPLLAQAHTVICVPHRTVLLFFLVISPKKLNLGQFEYVGNIYKGV